MRNLKYKIKNFFRKDRDAFELLFYVNEKQNYRSQEICFPNTFMEMLQLELGS